MSSRSSEMPETPNAASGAMRARDVDRVRARTLLDAAYEEGQLWAEEYHDRSDRAGTARTIGQLRGLVADLQPPAGVAGWSDPPRPNPAHRIGRYPDHIRARDEDRDLTWRALDVALADGQLSTEEHRTLTELTAEAKTLGDLAGLTEDLQKPAPAPIDPRSKIRPRAAWFAGAMVVVAIAAAVGGYRLTHRSSPPLAPVSAPVPQAVQPLVIETPDLTTAAGFDKFRSLYRAKFGDTAVDQVSLFPEYASIDRTTLAQPNRVADYDYRGGFLATSAMTTREKDKPILDLATVNVAALGDLINRSVALTKVEGGAVSHIIMDIDSITEAPTISVYVGNKFNERGYVEATPAGQLIRVSPFGD
ncbi:DUF1707 SHOCT-like domain-containing protein [Nocardia jiangxiensis]|uniref:DUF1707 SHOCT-like domain-containing protein n=1 Tax=Nocardia jiangxiensis TaxID=282685 RepID=UPI00146C363C|nr:DUF1707 domain-containing protein [Nocardia jiangxiensis]